LTRESDSLSVPDLSMELAPSIEKDDFGFEEAIFSNVVYMDDKTSVLKGSVKPENDSVLSPSEQSEWMTETIDFGSLVDIVSENNHNKKEPTKRKAELDSDSSSEHDDNGVPSNGTRKRCRPTAQNARDAMNLRRTNLEKRNKELKDVIFSTEQEIAHVKVLLFHILKKKQSRTRCYR